MPWKVLGRKWHLVKTGLPANGRVPWEFELVNELCRSWKRFWQTAKLSIAIAARSSGFDRTLKRWSSNCIPSDLSTFSCLCGVATISLRSVRLQIWVNDRKLNRSRMDAIRFHWAS